jgi:hypothetical protein
MLRHAPAHNLSRRVVVVDFYEFMIIGCRHKFSVYGSNERAAG